MEKVKNKVVLKKDSLDFNEYKIFFRQLKLERIKKDGNLTIKTYTNYNQKYYDYCYIGNDLDSIAIYEK